MFETSFDVARRTCFQIAWSTYRIMERAFSRRPTCMIACSHCRTPALRFHGQARFLNPLIMVISCIAIPVIVLHGSRHHIERWLGLQFRDPDYETRYRRQRDVDIQREARLYLVLSPFFGIVYLHTGQYAMFALNLGVLPFFFIINIPAWWWKAVGPSCGSGRTPFSAVAWMFIPAYLLCRSP